VFTHDLQLLLHTLALDFDT